LRDRIRAQKRTDYASTLRRFEGLDTRRCDLTIGRAAWLARLVDAHYFNGAGYLVRDVWDPFENRLVRAEAAEERRRA